jgi:hypothetical protein
LRTLTLTYKDTETNIEMNWTDIITEQLDHKHLVKLLLPLVSELEIKKYSEENILEKIWRQSE